LERAMDLNPPEGSKIWIASDDGDPTIVVPPTSGFGRYYVGFFLLFWLGMWSELEREWLARLLALLWASTSFGQRNLSYAGAASALAMARRSCHDIRL
jgi:hypothetical protein